MVNTEDIVVLKSVYSKTPDQSYFIQPCIDPETGDYPDCVRDRTEYPNGAFILSEQDKQDRSKGKVFIGKFDVIEIKHGQTFDLNKPAQRSVWEAVKHSKLIAPDRLAKSENGDYVIDGQRPYKTEQGLVLGKQGLADLYVDHPGIISKGRNEMVKLVNKAQNYVLNDTLEGWVTKAKLLEKDLSRAHPSDAEDYMLTQASKYPEKIIDLYTGNTTAIRLLLVTAIEKHVIVKKDGLLCYADNIILGASVDSAVKYLSNPENVKVKELIQQETFPDLYKKKTPLELAREAKKKDSEVKEA